MQTLLSRKMVVAALLAAMTTFSSCGKSLVRDLRFFAADENGRFMAGFDTTVDMGSGSLPSAKLPIYDPKAPARFLGFVETSPEGGISVRVDLSEAVRIQTTDGTLLPNGRDLPVSLPAGVVPIGIPVINSNSKVYVAVGEKNIMAGVAVTLVADTSSGNSDWLRVLRSLPTNIFYPFFIASDVKGTAGLFTGDRVGVSVFAVKSQDVAGTSIFGSVSPSTTVVNPDFSRRGLSIASSSFASAMSVGQPTVSSAPVSSEPEFFEVRTQQPTGSKMRRIQRALDKVRKTRLD